MSNLMPEIDLELHIGDSGKTLSHLFDKATRIEVQPLTGYSAWASFAYVGSDPHIVRACTVDGANGLAIYQLQGDELTIEGVIEFQFWVMAVDWYNGGAPGR